MFVGFWGGVDLFVLFLWGGEGGSCFVWVWVFLFFFLGGGGGSFFDSIAEIVDFG